MKKILPLFSYLFHPVFIPLFAVLYYLLLDGGYLWKSARYLLVIQVVIMTIMIPITTFFLLRSLGRVDTVMVKDIGQRRLPLVVQAMIFFLVINHSVSPHHSKELYFFFIGAFATTIISLVVLFLRIKSSLHMAGMGGLLFFVVGLSLHNAINLINTIAFLFLLTGLVAASRLYMKAHNSREIYIGLLAGCLPQMALYPFWL